MLYRTYLFTDKDPIIDEMRTAFQTSGKSIGEISRDSGLAESTIRNWFYGETERPQFASIQAFMRAVGFTMQAVTLHGASMATDKELKQAALVYKRNRERRRERMRKIIEGRKRRVAA